MLLAARGIARGSLLRASVAERRSPHEADRATALKASPMLRAIFGEALGLGRCRRPYSLARSCLGTHALLCACFVFVTPHHVMCEGYAARTIPTAALG